MEIKLANNNSYTYEEVKAAENNGGSFVTYQWIIPLPLFYPVRRLSKVYFIPKDGNQAKYAKKYNIISLIIGWWGLPFGPIFVNRSVRLNNNGGVDVTEDIYLNLDRTGYDNGRLEIVKHFTKFIHPSKSEIPEYKKVFKKLIDEGILKSQPVIGLFVDTEKNVEPYIIIGFNEELKGKEELISKAIYKRFYKQLKFELVDLNSDFEFKEALLTQGLNLESI
ncbi:hypothetical protein ERX46_04050 [Brumimicrobium glaciale]|uniref:Uncharacterized protein n=1 Tax=Brumimicrobium glaciale TaxID=200475 RepID=A0A4Q4KPU2_9FLAO|nr:hypothetical protein [Brumimicrobium glaciale]RYM34554.1 hypothetical protein ERX46_04050 [Brumimicrobium glaciale]